MAQRSLFEKYGGFSTVSKIVLSFYDELLDNDDIGPLFDNVDMAKQVDHQTKFISSLLGGPSSYTDAQIKQIHSHLEISDADYEETMAVLARNLSAHGVEDKDVKTVMKSLNARRNLVVK